MAKIQVEINGQLQDVKKVQLLDYANRGVITPNTKVIYNGVQLFAYMIKGLEFGSKNSVAVPHEPISVPLPKEKESPQIEIRSGIKTKKAYLPWLLGIGTGFIVIVFMSVLIFYLINSHQEAQRRLQEEQRKIEIAKRNNEIALHNEAEKGIATGKFRNKLLSIQNAALETFYDISLDYKEATLAANREGQDWTRELKTNLANNQLVSDFSLMLNQLDYDVYMAKIEVGMEFMKNTIYQYLKITGCRAEDEDGQLIVDFEKECQKEISEITDFARKVNAEIISKGGKEHTFGEQEFEPVIMTAKFKNPAGKD
jgi:vacuolar-type H+-ATPase subunit E/Vma4